MEEKKYRDEAIPLISIQEGESEFTVNPEAIEFLNSVPKPIAVVGVAGLYRTGKSFLLNRVILNRGKGFGVGPTINPCTKGIWIWGRPMKGEAEDGKIVNVLVIDSEGIGALDEHADHDNRIFSLAILLSSNFIYNSLGSIDETAIQNLNLICNITKNIHIRATQDEEIEAEEYATYFPSFMWVVRDFTLRLEDSEGDQITSKQYLNNALEDQQGFSEAVEKKNRIRRMIRSFFPDRDCYTMIRPILEESQIQDLPNMELDQLRPDFIEQALYLRKRIMTRAKPKLMNNKPLSGKMLGSLLNNYVGAINKGSIPNIESAWTYICRDQCQQALNEAFKEFDEGMTETLEQSFPVSSGYLKTLYQDLRDTAVVSYKRSAVGETSEKKLKELVNKMEQKYYQLDTDNRRQYETLLQTTMASNYKNIKHKLDGREYKSFFEFEKDLRNFQIYFLDSDPNGPGKELIISEFMNQKLPEGVYQIIKDLNKENEEQIMLLKQAKSKIDAQLEVQKEIMMKKVNEYENKLADLHNEKSDLEVKKQCVEDNFNDYKKRKEMQEQSSKDEYETELAERQKKITNLETFVKGLEEKISEVERNALIDKSEYEKEKALLSQKLQHYEQQSVSHSERERGMADQIMKVREEMNDQLKIKTQKLKNEIEKKESERKTFEERWNESEDELRVMRERLQDVLESSSKTERKLREEVTSMEGKMQALNEELELFKENGKNLLDEPAMEALKTKIEELTKKYEDSDTLAKERLDKVNKLESKLKNLEAVSAQNIEFLEKRLEMLRAKIEEDKKKYSNALTVFEGQSHSNEDFQKTLKEMEVSHSKEMRNLEGQLEETRNRLTEKINKLTEENHVITSQKNSENEQFSDKVKKLEGDISSLEKKNKNLNDQILSIEEDKSRLVGDIEEISFARQKELQQEIEEMREKHMKEISENEENNQKNLDEMKQFYEEERNRLENKLAELKSKADKKFKKMEEEYIITLERERQEHEEEIENLHQDLKEFEINQIAFRQQYEQEIGTRQQAIMSLEATNKELKTKLANLETKSNGNLEQMMNSLKEDRETYMKTIDELKTQLTQKDKEIYTRNQKMENLENENKEFKEKIQKYKDGEIGEIGDLKKNISEMTKKYQELSESHMEMKIESEKTIALRNQQNEFLKNRIDELQSMLDQNHSRTETKMRKQREEYQNEISKILSDGREDKRILEDKYEQKRKSLKELESEYSIRFRNLENDKTHLTEKLENTLLQLSKLQIGSQEEIEKLKSKIEELKVIHHTEKKRLQENYDILKNINYKTDLEKAEIISTFDRDKSLLENKIKFFENQTEELRQEVEESRKIFDDLLIKFRNVKKNQEDETAFNNTALLSSLEQKYKSQIEELRESKKLMNYEYNEKVASLERELRIAREKLKSNSNNIEATEYKMVQEKLRIKEALENKLKQDLDKVKKERDNKSLEYQKLMDDQRERYKRKQNDLETRIKSLEKKKSSLMFEYDKERTKWNVEKDHLNTQLEDKLELLHSMEKKRESLLRENEKLKNENRKNKKLLGNHFPNSLSSMANGGNFLFNLNSSKFGDRSFLRADHKTGPGTLASDKDEKENNLPSSSGKFSVLDKLSSPGSRTKTPSKSFIGKLGFNKTLSSNTSNIGGDGL